MALHRLMLFRSNLCLLYEYILSYSNLVSYLKQAAVSHDLKMWWMSHLNDMDAHIPTNSQYYKLLPSPSVEQSEADADLESLPLLSVVSGDSSTSLANYVNILPTKSGLGDLEQVGRRTYFEMRLKRSPGTSKEIFYIAVK